MLMEQLRVLLLDDEQNSLEQSKAALENFVAKENVYPASSVVEAMRILEYHPVDLAFVDIEMPDTHGFSVAEFIHGSYPQVKVVFLTGHVELGAQSFEYEPFDFLGKPVDVMRLRKTLQRYIASGQKDAAGEERVALDTGTGLVFLSPADICYIAKEKRRTVIYCQDRSFPVQYTLEEIEAILADYDLFRTHQSFVVPLRRIVSILPADFGKTYTAKLDTGTEIPVSRIQYSKLRGHLTARGVRIL